MPIFHRFPSATPAGSRRQRGALGIFQLLGLGLLLLFVVLALIVAVRGLFG